MAIITLAADGSAPAQLAWERYADPALWARWAPQISRVDADADRIVPGMTGRVHGPLGVSIDFVVDEVDEQARTWSWTVHRGPLTLHLHHSVRSRGDACSTSLTVEGPLPVVLAYAPVARYALGRLVRPDRSVRR